MGMPVKLSDLLVSAARAEAKATNRSITAQVEHWAKLGRAVEAALKHADLLELKRSKGDLDRAFSDAARRDEVLSLLEEIARSSVRDVISEKLRARGKPVYATDPAYPGMLVRIDPDGTRTPGNLENRKFIPSKSASKRSKKHGQKTG